MAKMNEGRGARKPRKRHFGLFFSFSLAYIKKLL